MLWMTIVEFLNASNTPNTAEMVMCTIVVITKWYTACMCVCIGWGDRVTSFKYDASVCVCVHRMCCGELS